jgi:small subunit ribosomal protein S10
MDKNCLFAAVEEIRTFLKKADITFSGPIFMPVKNLRIQTRKSPDGEGTEKWDKWRISKYKVFFLADPSEKLLKKLMFLDNKKNIQISLNFTGQ